MRSRFLSVVLLAAVFVTTFGALAPQAATADVSAPSWWNGDCDANNWNAKAAALGWTGAGAHRLGASYLGVPVCGPRRNDGAPDVQWSRPGWGHFEWECTELTFRFMALVYGVAAYGANGNTVVANYRTTYGGGLQTVKNGTPGVAPRPGDVMSFDGGDYGHAAVVAGSVVDGSGNGQIKLLTQNDTADGWRTLSVTAWVVQPFGSYVPSAWLTDPQGRGGSGIAVNGGSSSTSTPTTTPSSPSSPSKPAPVSPSVPAVYLRNKLTTGIADSSFNFGQRGDQVLACDWDGDGRDSPAWFRNGLWGIVNQNVANAEVWNATFGQAGDIPVCGDWDGNGSDNIGVWRAGVFYLRNVNSTGPASATFAFGNATDRPVVGDWDGDRKATIGVYRSGQYFLRNANSTGPASAVFLYGDAGDEPLAGDWNGDGRDTIGIWRNTALYLRNSITSGIADYVFAYGNSGDRPIIGDWDKSSTDELGIFRVP